MRMLTNAKIQEAVDSITEGMIEPSSGWSLDEAATACVYWCIVHKGWRDGTDLGMTKKAAKEQLHRGPLSGRPIGAIEPKVMNVTSAAQKLLRDGLPIFNQGRYSKRGTSKDMGPMVCKGFAPAANYQDCLLQLLPKALDYFELLPKQSITDSDIGRINSLLSSYSEIPDGRKPGDSKRAGRFRSGWKDATERNKGEYSEDSLSKITWQNLGYRLGNELGNRSGQWINAAYEHIAASWDAKFYAPTIDNQVLEEQVEALREFRPLGLPPKGRKRPAKRMVAQTESVERDAEVKRWVLDNAKGICELCEAPSPYRSKTKGNPWYLEVHHVVPLKADGPDTVCNAVALCPNCHTRCHQSIDASEATEQLYRQVKRLVRPG